MPNKWRRWSPPCAAPASGRASSGRNGSRPAALRADEPDHYEGQAQITGYVTRNSVGVTIPKLALAPDVIAAGFAAGANSVSWPNLSLRDNTTALDSARRDAIAKARSDAYAYADGLSLKVVRILRVSERGNYASPTLYISTNRSRASAPTLLPPTPPPLSGREMREQATLWVNYALVPK